jgi:transcriptional regulator with XRE-family HTH domain
MTLPDITTIDERIGAAIRAERVQAGLKQEELAKALGLDRTTLSRYEAGSRSVPVGVLLQIATLLHVPINALIPGSSPMNVAADMVRQDADSAQIRVIAQTLVRRPDLTPQVLELLSLLIERESLTAP